MTEHSVTPAAHDHHDGHHHAASPFTEAQMHELHRSDIGAGGAVIVLMTAIFTMGLLLYGVIAIIVAS